MEGHRARKRFSQNFLHDAHYIERIVTAIDPRPGDRIVEIGPGLGALTAPLVQRAAVITANLRERNLGSAIRDIEATIQRTPPPAGVTTELAGQNREMQRSFASLWFAMGLAIFLVYLVMASLAALGGAAALVLSAMEENLIFFYSPSDIQAQKAPRDRSIRIGGLVEQGTIMRGADGTTVTFKVTDTVNTIPATYRGILPDLFREGQGVVAEGRLRADGVFEATSVLMLRTAGIDLAVALSATLLFRGLSFWLPLVPGYWCSSRLIAPRPTSPG